MSEDRKDTGAGVSYNPLNQYDPEPHYVTFQGVANYPPQPVLGFPPPPPPPGPVPSPAALPPPHFYPHGYHSYPGHPVVEGRPVIERPLFCCGCGNGWCLTCSASYFTLEDQIFYFLVRWCSGGLWFIIGFFLAAIPWYIGAIILFCARPVDYREKPGYIACTIAAIVTTITIFFGSADDDWYFW